ncbi:Excreted virulence factor EspC, type VII ESX diderm [Prescottella defluvii]|uniref:hypothetical protein n=1 Tax=Prescottella defluvii TaxID=1323361 RepID=UPI00055ACD5E|nr:hypothetical protein [Prescottella defluvii]
MLVDQGILRAFARETAETSETIAGTDLREPIVSGTAGMPGSTSEWAARMVSDFLSASGRTLADGYGALAATASGNAESYEVSDEDFASSVEKVLPAS